APGALLGGARRADGRRGPPALLRRHDPREPAQPRPELPPGGAPLRELRRPPPPALRRGRLRQLRRGLASVPDPPQRGVLLRPPPRWLRAVRPPGREAGRPGPEPGRRAAGALLPGAAGPAGPGAPGPLAPGRPGHRGPPTDPLRPAARRRRGRPDPGLFLVP